MTFARRVFLIAGIYGLIVIVPLYFLERSIGELAPPPLTHPEFYYGFAGVTAAWQIAFLVIARDPVRFRPLIPVAVLEKVGYIVPTAILFARGRVAPLTASGAIGDLILGALFVVAYIKTAHRDSANLSERSGRI